MAAWRGSHRAHTGDWPLNDKHRSYKEGRK